MTTAAKLKATSLTFTNDKNNFATSSKDAFKMTVTAGHTAADYSGTPSEPSKVELTAGTDRSKGVDLQFKDAHGKISFASEGAITGLKLPANPSDATSKTYVDSVAQGLKPRGAVKAASTGNIALSTSTLQIGDQVDGYSLQETDRVLLKDQSDAKENGIYVVQASGVQAVRAADLTDGNGTPVPTEGAAGVYVFVLNGTANKDKGFVCTADGGSDKVGTHALPFTHFQSSAAAASGSGDITNVLAGTGLTKAGSDSGDVTLSLAATIKRDGTGAAANTTFQPADAANASAKTASDASKVLAVKTAFQSDTSAAGTETFSVLANGTCTGNEFIADSDRRLKKNIMPLPTSAALQAVAAMGPVTYEFKSRPEDPRCGVIAQELAEIAPELVKHTAKGTLAVDYNDMNAYLIGAIQALKSQVDEQADVIQRLSQQIPVAAL